MANRVAESIGWADVTVNPVKGLCPVKCTNLQGRPYCYARRLYQRFYWEPEIRFDPFVFCDLPRRPSRIFVGSTMELFGPWVKDKWMRDILDYCRRASWLTFIFLTKRPEELARWSPFPPNCHIGVSVTNQAMHNEAIVGLAAIEAAVKFISFEPLLEAIPLHSPYDLSGIQWAIIGQQTPVSARTAPKIEWVKDIVEAADKAGVAVFLKDSLWSLFDTPGHYEYDFRPTGYVDPVNPWACQRGVPGRELRQEWPG